MLSIAKGHGLGNDYIVIEARNLSAHLEPTQIRDICDRHTGVGSDGILVLVPAWNGADFGVRIFNPDGSEAEKSGNGLRILAKYISDRRLTTSEAFTIDTAGGRVGCLCETVDGRVQAVTVDMGLCTFWSPEIPVAGPNREVVNEQLQVGDDTLRVTAVSVGNPHCIVVLDALDESYVRRMGPLIESHFMFPKRTNVQFARILSRSSITIMIWERGAGWTLASGSSSCAVAAAAVKLGLCDYGSVDMHMPGGVLRVDVGEDWGLRLYGPVEAVFTGQVSPGLLDPRTD